MVGLTPSQVWKSLEPHYAKGDIATCVRIVRAVVEADPFDIGKRYLLARLYLKQGDPDLATRHFAKLLPLCAGRGDLFRAIAMQKHLDAIAPPQTLHPARYASLRHWFRCLTPVRNDTVRSGAVVQEALLLSLPANGFTAAAQSLALDLLEPGVSVREAGGGTLWILLHGELIHSTQGADGSWSEPRRLEEGHYLLTDVARGTAESRFEGAAPAEMLRLEASAARDLSDQCPEFASALAELQWGMKGAKNAGPLQRRGTRAAPVGLATGERLLPPAEAAGAAPGTPAEHGQARAERRSHDRVTVCTSRQTALISLPAPAGQVVEGTVRDLSNRGMCITLPAGEQGEWIQAQLRSIVHFELEPPGGGRALRLSGWLRWCCRHGQAWVVGLEFAHMSQAEREALVAHFCPELSNAEYGFESWEKRLAGSGGLRLRGAASPLLIALF